MTKDREILYRQIILTHIYMNFVSEPLIMEQ